MNDQEQLRMAVSIQEVLTVMNKIIQDTQGDHPSAALLNVKMKHLNEYIDLMTPYKITADMVKELRNETGESILACAAALNKARGDMVTARRYLR